MYNKYMTKEQLNVKVGDRVRIAGFWIGTVTEVCKSIEKKWNGTEYEEVKGTESTAVKVHFDNPKEIGYQYQDSHYGNYEIVKGV